MKRVKLSELNYDHFEEAGAWRVIPETLEEVDASLEPALLNSRGEVTRENEEVWCLCQASFSNGSAHRAAAMCRGDSGQGPLLWTIWNGVKDVSLQLPPAPPPVLKVDGPEPFCASFDLNIADVFPIRLVVIPRFEQKPNLRKVMLDTTGVTDV